MGKKYEDDEMEIDLLELVRELLNHWIGIVAAAVLAAAICLAYTMFMVTPQYTSTSILYVLSASTSITSYTDIQIGTNLTSDYVEVVNGRPVLDQVIENLGLDMEYDELLDKVSITNPDDTRLLEITVSDADPALAKDIADEIADVARVYISNKMDQDPPSVIQYGYIATSPDSPSVPKNTLLGGLVGAVLAMAIVVISYLMNDTVTSPEDLEKRIGLNVLASLPKDDNSDFDDNGESRRKRRKKEKEKTA